MNERELQREILGCRQTRETSTSKRNKSTKVELPECDRPVWTRIAKLVVLQATEQNSLDHIP